MNGVLIFVGISFIIAILLTYVSYVLNNKEGKNVSKIRDMLPGYNCGACGFVGCDQMAENLVDDKDLLIKCKPMKKEDYNKLMRYLNNRK